MNDKDLLFVLVNGDEYIKGKYVAEVGKIFYLSQDENSLFTNLNELEENSLHIYEENKFEMTKLIEEIRNDKLIYEKIKNNPNEKLMFRYENEIFNRFLEELTQG